MPDWYRDHALSPECYPESEYRDWAQDNGLYVDAAGNVGYGPPEREDDYDPDLAGREQDEPDFDAIAEAEHQEHCDEDHGGGVCDCPLPPLPEPAKPGDPNYATEAPF